MKINLFKIFFLLATFFLLPNFAKAAVFNVSLTGTKTVGSSIVDDWSDSNCYGDIANAIKKMTTGAGDTVVINDGVYTGTSNMINFSTNFFPPSGTAGNFTTIKARNIGQTIIDGQYLMAPFDNSNQEMPASQYLHVDGIHFRNGNCGVFSIKGSYNKVTNCGFEDGQSPSSIGQCPIANLIGGNGDTGNPIASTYNLFEDDWAWGRGRYGLYFGGNTPGADHSIFRRVVIRQDDAAQGPVSGIMFYNGHDNVCQNCIVLDGTDTSASEHYGAFAATANYPLGAPTTLNHLVIGSIGLNNAKYSGFFPQENINTFTLKDTVLWGNLNGVTLSSNTVGTISSDHLTVGASTYRDGFNSNPGYTTGFIDVINSITANNTRYGLYYTRNASFVNNFGNIVGAMSGATATNSNTINPFLDSLKYLPRIETGSQLKGIASDGGDIGANILYQIGKSGSLYDEADWSTQTATPLWPLPNESIWAAKIKAYNASGPGGDRGFAHLAGSTATPLTDYIWSYLGNKKPDNIYNSISSLPSQFANLTSCQLSTNPNSLISTCTDTQAPNDVMPELFNGTPATRYTSLFGAKYFRITTPTAPIVENSQVTSMYPDYAKVPAWNSDGSKMWLFDNKGYIQIYDGKTYAWLERLTSGIGWQYDGQDNEPRWSHTDPNIIYYVSGMKFNSYNISTHTTSTLHTFNDLELGGVGLANIHNGDEGNPDDYDRYWAFYAQDGSYLQKVVFVYDKNTDTVLSHKDFSANGLCGIDPCPTTINWIGVSHSGYQILINWNLDASDGDLVTRGKGSEVFDKDLNYLNKSSEKNWHCDVAQTMSGSDVYVGSSHLNEINGYKAIRVVRLSDGAVIKSCMLPQSQFNHISARSDSSLLKGWILYSTYDQTGAGLGITTPGGLFSAENFALNIDTCEVRRIAHNQSYWSGTNYFSEPHATMNFDFTKIIWGSNWRNQNDNVQAYVSDLTLNSVDAIAPSAPSGLAVL